MNVPMKLTRRKVGDQKYELRNDGGDVVATVVKNGTHLDDYPWDVILEDGWDYPPRGYIGAQESLKTAVDVLSYGARRVS